MRVDRDGGIISPPAVHQRPTLPSKKGTPIEPRGLDRGGRHKSMGVGAQTPHLKPRRQGKGNYKSQETTKLNTKVGTAGERGVGEREVQSRPTVPQGPRPLGSQTL